MEPDRHDRAVFSAIERRDEQIGTQSDDSIPLSWERCREVYALLPDRIGRPEILTSTELQDHREPVGDLLGCSQGEIQRLFELLSEQDYVVMLTDAHGIAVDFRSNASALDACDAAGVLPGSIWTEERQGTNGISLCIKEQRPVSVVMADHFAAMLGRISCTVAPIFGGGGQLLAVLNVTTLLPSDRAAQSVVRKLVAASARRIENIYFDRRNIRNEIVRLSRHGDFCDSAAETRVALNASGRVVDATPAAQRMLAGGGGPIVGQMLSLVPGMEDWLIEWNRQDAPLVMEQGKVYLRLDGLRKRPTATPVLSDGARSSRPTIRELVGDDDEIRESIGVAQRLVAHHVPVLLQGETGTGKSALARALHLDSGGEDSKFISVNCAAITSELIESELFGYRPGAFTGASRQGSKGRLLEADGGMLFLDEIGDMPLGLQTRLLQVLSDGEFVPVGAIHPVKVSFALVAASLHDVARLVRDGRFREDLYYRLAGATVRLPALRERHDRVQLIEHVFGQAAISVGKQMPRIAEPAKRALAAHSWPGNLRELQHAARFALAVDNDGVIELNDLPPPLNCSGGTEVGSPGRCRRNAIEAALQRCHWNVSEAATSLGVSRSTLHRQMRSLGIDRPDE
ncbi:sigma-54-dependent Fis family transcriptional regulator [Burkholderia multivorans]|uniref:sigma-54-dependent Fis family transcriptional regulator n=1 Tax=Burkholderia multivorans TaxID=87883 RepID=UPI00158D31F3|nr:sigma-54-dependent Fis family transcriptional regulator [Burkholderia multivorans]